VKVKDFLVLVSRQEMCFMRISHSSILIDGISIDRGVFDETYISFLVGHLDLQYLLHGIYRPNLCKFYQILRAMWALFILCWVGENNGVSGFGS
jgi:hypothetical protein